MASEQLSVVVRVLEFPQHCVDPMKGTMEHDDVRRSLDFWLAEYRWYILSNPIGKRIV